MGIYQARRRYAEEGFLITRHFAFDCDSMKESTLWWWYMRTQKKAKTEGEKRRKKK